MSGHSENSNHIAGALTFPARSDEDLQPAPVQPRQPTNLQGLLRFAMEATKAEDAPGNSQIGPMDEARRNFLEEALKSLTVDIAAVLRDAIQVLSDADKINAIQLGEALPEDVDTAFKNILEYVCDLDIANDFHKLGGFAIFPVCFGSENDAVRTQACNVLAELCQNNPYCQARALETGLLNVLLNLAQSEKGAALTKCVYAISSATRAFEPACKEFLAQGGCETLAQLLTVPEDNTRVKVVFLIKYFIITFKDAKDKFTSLNIVQHLSSVLHRGWDFNSEHYVSCLLSLVDNPAALQQARNQSLNLRETLEGYKKREDLSDDEKSLCDELVKVLGDVYVVDDEVADR